MKQVSEIPRFSKFRKCEKLLKVEKMKFTTNFRIFSEFILK